LISILGVSFRVLFQNNQYKRDLAQEKSKNFENKKLLGSQGRLFIFIAGRTIISQ